jgi:streptogrisin C
MNGYRSRITASAVAVMVAVAGFASPASAQPEPDDPMVLALAAEDGITPQQAADKLARQGDSQRLAERLDRELGARIAGSYLDRRSAGLVVNVNDEATARAVREAGATAVVVSHTRGELNEVKAWLDRLAVAGGAEAMDSYYLDATRNVVVVNSPSAAVAEQLRVFGSRVEIGSERGAVGETTALNVLPGGTEVWRWNNVVNKFSCTAGFTARNAAGTKYMVTASHCVLEDAAYLNIGAFKFGDRAYYGLPFDDATVKNNSPAFHVQHPNVSMWNGFVAVIKGWFTTIEGSYVCKSGITTKWGCGYVTLTGISGITKFPDGVLRWIHQLTRAGICVRKGDSGGPVVTKPGSYYYATGTVSTGNAISPTQCNPSPTMHFQPIAGTLFRSGLSLVTG